MKLAIAGVTSILLSLSAASVVQSDDLPEYLTGSFPEHALMDILKSYGTLKGEEALLDAKTHEMIALGVAAQIPCEYCVYNHTESLKKLGVSEEEIKEAVAIAAYIRMFSTALNGNPNLNMDAYRKEKEAEDLAAKN